jgi:hypothetical protein
MFVLLSGSNVVLKELTLLGVAVKSDVSESVTLCEIGAEYSLRLRESDVRV